MTARVLRNRAGRPAGWVLSELLVVLLLTGLFAAGLVGVATAIGNGVRAADRSAQLRMALCTTLFHISRDLRAAGCDPWREGEVPGIDLRREGGQDIGVELHADRRGHGPGSMPDGDAGDPDERVLYLWDRTSALLRRNGQPMLDDARGNPSRAPMFHLERDGQAGFMRVTLTAGRPDETLTLATGVCLRNPQP